MKKIFAMLLMLVMGVALFAEDNEIVVEVSVPGDKVNKKTQEELWSKANKNAVKKYLLLQNAQMEERVLDEAMKDAEKYVDGKPSEEDEPSPEDGEVKAKYTVTIKQEEVAKFLELRGVNNNKNADGTELKIVVMEEVPDAGQMQLGDDVSKFFFLRYNMFQRKIRDALNKKTTEFGFKVKYLDKDEKYKDLKKKDPVLVGVSYDVNKDTRGFTKTPDFIATVQENDPDTIALYYRIDTLAYDPSKGVIRTTVALSLENLSNDETQNIGDTQYELNTSNTQQDMLMDDFGECVKKAMFKLLNSEGMGAKLNHMVASMRAAAARPKGPMKLVVNCSKVDKKIKIKFRTAIKKALIERGITDQKNLKIVKDSLSCKVLKKDLGDLDDLWGEVSEIITEAGVEDLDDDAAKKNGDTLTVTPGK